MAGDVRRSEQLHDQLMADIRTLITLVGDSSKLILDPDLDTYYIMDALLLREPEIDRRAERARRRRRPVARRRSRASRPISRPGSPVMSPCCASRSTASRPTSQAAFAETTNFNENDELGADADAAARPAPSTTTTRRRRPRRAGRRPGRATAPRCAKRSTPTPRCGSRLFDQEDKMLDTRQDGDSARRQFAFTAVGVALLLSRSC